MRKSAAVSLTRNLQNSTSPSAVSMFACVLHEQSPFCAMRAGCRMAASWTWTRLQKPPETHPTEGACMLCRRPPPLQPVHVAPQQRGNGRPRSRSKRSTHADDSSGDEDPLDGFTGQR